MPGSMKNAESADAFVAALSGWRRELVVLLRRTATSVRGLEERIKWGNVVYFATLSARDAPPAVARSSTAARSKAPRASRTAGPVLMIRAEPKRVLFGFWRGQRLRDIEPRLKPGGKYEMATLELRADDSIEPRVARRLVEAAVALNAVHGDPTDLASRGSAPRTVVKKRSPTGIARTRTTKAAKPPASRPRGRRA